MRHLNDGNVSMAEAVGKRGRHRAETHSKQEWCDKRQMFHFEFLAVVHEWQ